MASSESYMQVTNGCRSHPDCFSCPFDDCIEGEAVNLKRQMQEIIKGRAQFMILQGRKVPEIAGTLGVSRRTIFRYQRAMLC